jgi:hypothetical protein
MKDIRRLFDVPRDFFTFMRQQFPVFHEANIFFRDLDYAIIYFLRKNGIVLEFRDSEQLTMEIVTRLESQGYLKQINPSTWMLNYPEFATPKKIKTTK